MDIKTAIILFIKSNKFLTQIVSQLISTKLIIIDIKKKFTSKNLIYMKNIIKS